MTKAFQFETTIQVIEVQVSATGQHTFTVKGGVKPGRKRIMYGTTAFSGVLPKEIAEPFIAGVEEIFQQHMDDVLRDAPLRRGGGRRRQQDEGEDSPSEAEADEE